MIAKMKNLRTLSTWLWHTWRGYRTQAVLNVIVGLLQVVIDLTFVWVTKLTIDVATGGRTGLTLTVAIALLVGAIVGQITLGVVSRWIRAILGVRAQNKMQRNLFARLLRSQWVELRAYHTGDLLNRIERDVTDVIRFLTEHLPSLLIAIFQFFGAFLFLFLMDKKLAVIIVLILPVFLVMSRLYVRRMRQITHEVRALESRVQSIIQESLGHTLLLKSLRRGAEMEEKLSITQRDLRGQIVERTKYSTISSTVMNIGFAAGYLISFSWGVVSLQQGLITYGALIAFVQLVGQIQQPVRTLSRFIPVFIGSFTATERLMQLEDIPLETVSDDIKCTAPVGLRIEDVHYAYSDHSRRILDGVSHTMPPGSVTAIVGETGAGKTTLIRLILSVLQPNNGRITLYNDHETVPISAATRTNFAYIPQGNTLLSGTVRENLLLGNPQATEEQLREALHIAVADFIWNRPESIDTRCGEVGDGFSEGQAQRLSIARAWLTEAPVILFDEATSSLDEETERTLLKRIMEKRGQRTLVFVTHRPEVLKYCEKTLTLKRTDRD